jgi:hypothetical protein
MLVAGVAVEMAASVVEAIQVLVLLVTVQQTEAAVVAVMELALDKLVLVALVSLSFAIVLYKRKNKNAT